MGSDACESSGPVQVGDVRCRRVRACVAALQLDVDGQVFEARGGPRLASPACDILEH